MNGEVLKPPYRLNNSKEIDSYVMHYRPVYLPDRVLRRMTVIQVKQPEILGVMPKRVDVTHETRSVRIEPWNDEQRFQMRPDGLPELRMQAERTARLLPYTGGTYRDMVIACCAPLGEVTVPTDPTGIRGILGVLEQRDRLVRAALRRALETGDPNSIEGIDQVIRGLMLFSGPGQTPNAPLVTALEKDSASWSRENIDCVFLNHTRGVQGIVTTWWNDFVKQEFERRLARFVDNGTPRELLPALIGHTRIAIGKSWIESPSRVQEMRTRGTVLLDAFESRYGRDSVSAARSRFTDFADKIERFRNLVWDLFPFSVVANAPAGMSKKAVQTQAVRYEFLLYPSKDLHDIAKGFFSADCTNPLKNLNLAARHLEHETFFNIRVFLMRRWIGNVYCLEIRRPNGHDLVLDQINIERVPGIDSDLFVTDILTALTTTVETLPLTIDLWLQTTSVSGKRWIRQAVERWVLDRPGLRREKNLVPRNSAQRNAPFFESGRPNREFVLLTDSAG